MSILFTAQGDFIKPHLTHTLKSYFYSTQLPIFYLAFGALDAFGAFSAFDAHNAQDDLERLIVDAYPSTSFHLTEEFKPFLKEMYQLLLSVAEKPIEPYQTHQFALFDSVYFLLAPIVKRTDGVSAMPKGSLCHGAFIAGPICLSKSGMLQAKREENLKVLAPYLQLRLPPSHFYLAQLIHHLTKNSVYVGPNQTLTPEQPYINRKEMALMDSAAYTHNRLAIIADLVLKHQKHEALSLYKKSILFDHFGSNDNDHLLLMRQLLTTLETLISHPLYEQSFELSTLMRLKNAFFSQFLQSQSHPCLVEAGENMIKVYSELVHKKNLEGKTQPIRKAMLFIQENFRQPITIQNICNFVNRSRTYVSIKFKEETDMTVTDYIKTTRVNYSKHLLLHTDSSILHIALESGFDSQAYFSTVFKQMTGQTPNQFRNQGVV